MDRVSFCVGKGCCPEADFHDDGSVSIVEDGKHVPFSKAEADKLADELAARGYGTAVPTLKEPA